MKYWKLICFADLHWRNGKKSRNARSHIMSRKFLRRLCRFLYNVAKVYTGYTTHILHSRVIMILFQTCWDVHTHILIETHNFPHLDKCWQTIYINFRRGSLCTTPLYFLYSCTNWLYKRKCFRSHRYHLYVRTTAYGNLMLIWQIEKKMS